MYVTLLEHLIEPILLDKICEVEIRELVEKKSLWFNINGTKIINISIDW